MDSVTITGNAIKINSPFKANINNLKINFLPWQTGANAPSLNNIRPIQGWTGIDVRQCGKNLFTPLVVGDALDSNTGNEITDPNRAASDFIPVTFKNNNIYYWSGIYDGMLSSVFAYNAKKEFLGRTVAVKRSELLITPSVLTYVTSSATGDIAYLRFAQIYNDSAESSIDIVNSTNYMLSTYSLTESYTNIIDSNYSVTWTGQGIIYGGYIDLVTGELTQTWARKQFKDFENILLTTAVVNGRFRIENPGMKQYSTSRITPLYCSCFQPITDGRAVENVSDNSIYGGANVTNIYIHAYSYSTVDAFLEAFGDEYVCYELATPITYQLTGQQIKTLCGTNNFYTNGNGSLECTYEFADSQEILTAKKRVMIQSAGNFIPPQYTKVDYIQTQGHNTRINTGVTGNDETLKISCTFMPVSLSSAYTAVFGNYQSESNHYGWRCILQNTTATNYQRGFYVTAGNTAPNGSGAPAPFNSDEIMLYKKIKINLAYGSYTMTGTKTVTQSFTTASKTANNYNIAIGSSNPTATGSSAASKFRIYNFKLESQGKLVRNYIPVIRKSDNVAGFYDTINQTFNPSIGSAEFIGGNDETILPEYTAVDYLTTTGHDSRIDSGVPGNTSGLRVEFDWMRVDNNIKASYYGPFGNASDASQKFWFISSPQYTSNENCSKIRIAPCTTTPAVVEPFGEGVSILNKKMHCVFTDGSAIINGTAQTVTVSGTDVSAANIMFGTTSATSSGVVAAEGRFWGIKMYANNTMIRNYVPVIRNSDGKAGFYDIINSTFNPSIGSEEFIAGYETLPSEYTEVEYLQSSGSQYINTGIVPSNSIGFEITYLTTNTVGSSGYGCIFGGRAGVGDNDLQVTSYTNSSERLGEMRFGNTTTKYSAGIVVNTKQTVAFRNLVFTNASGTNYTYSSYSWTTPKPIYLFALNNNGTAAQSNNGCRIYNAKFFNGNTLTNNFIPCTRNSDSKPGLYDVVSSTFTVNAGSGEFTVLT